MSSRGYSEPLTNPSNHKDNNSLSLRTFDNHFKMLNDGLISVTKNITTLHNRLGLLENTVAAAQPSELKLRIENIERSLTTHSKLISEVRNMVSVLNKAKLQEKNTNQLTAQPSQVVSQVASQPTTQPVSQLGSQVASQPTTQPVSQLGSQVASQPTTQPVSQLGSQPTLQSSQPVSQKSTKLVQPVHTPQPVQIVPAVNLDEVVAFSSPTVDPVSSVDVPVSVLNNTKAETTNSAEAKNKSIEEPAPVSNVQINPLNLHIPEIAAPTDQTKSDNTGKSVITDRELEELLHPDLYNPNISIDERSADEDLNDPDDTDSELEISDEEPATTPPKLSEPPAKSLNAAKPAGSVPKMTAKQLPVKPKLVTRTVVKKKV